MIPASVEDLAPVISNVLERDLVSAKDINMIELLLGEDEQKDYMRDLLQFHADHGTTSDEWNVMRALPAYKAGKQAQADGIRRSLAQLRSVSPHLFLSALPVGINTAKANTGLAYDWSKRNDEETRLKAIETRFGGFTTKLTDIEVVSNPLTNLPIWEVGAVVSPVDALLWMGIDPTGFLKDKPSPKAGEAYCALLRHLSLIPGLKLGDYYQDCIRKDGAKPDPDCITAWLRFPTQQKTGGALTVRLLPTNPAIWFQMEDAAYSIAPLGTRKLLGDVPEGNKVKKVNVGDMITVASFLAAEPHIVSQIAAGTCPRIDVAGTQLRSSDDWPFSPYACQGGGRTYLGYYYADVASGRFGSFGCAME